MTARPWRDGGRPIFRKRRLTTCRAAAESSIRPTFANLLAVKQVRSRPSDRGLKSDSAASDLLASRQQYPGRELAPRLGVFPGEQPGEKTLEQPSTIRQLFRTICLVRLVALRASAADDDGVRQE